MLNFAPLKDLKKPVTGRIFLFIIAGIFTWFIGDEITNSLPTVLQPIAGLSVFAAIIALVIGGIKVKVAHDKQLQRNQQAYTAFATANTFAYEPTASDEHSGSGTLFSIGHTKHIAHILRGTHKSGLPLEVFHYSYDTGSGKNRRSHYASVARLTLPRKVPHMVIDSLVEQGTESVLPITFDRSQQVKVEGDFNQYFALYAPDTYAVSLLSIIGPDVMWALMQHAAACDIEIIDNYIYFYWPTTAYTSEDYQRMFATIDAVMHEVGRKLTAGNIYTSDSQAALHGEAAARGARLKTNRTMAIVATLFIAVFFVQYVAPEQISEPLGLLFVVVVLGLIIASLVQGARKQKRRQKLLQRFPAQTTHVQR